MAVLAAICAAKAGDWATKGCRAQTPMLSARHPTERLALSVRHFERA